MLNNCITKTKTYETIKGLGIALKKEKSIFTGFSLIKANERNLSFGQMTFNHIKHNTNRNLLELSYKLENNDSCINAMIISNFESAIKTVETSFYTIDDAELITEAIRYEIQVQDSNEVITLSNSRQVK